MKRVIVADDMAMVRSATVRVLRSLNLEIVEADDGHTALALAKDSPPDLVITDGEMRQMHGPELIEELRRDPTFAAVPIILCSGNRDLKEVADKLGVPFHPKSNGLLDLRELVQKALGIV